MRSDQFECMIDKISVLRDYCNGVVRTGLADKSICHITFQYYLIFCDESSKMQHDTEAKSNQAGVLFDKKVMDVLKYIPLVFQGAILGVQIDLKF